MQILDQILAVFGPKILIFMGVRKSFGTNITENHLDNLSALFFGQFLDQMGQKCQYLAENASFGPNLAVFGRISNPKIYIADFGNFKQGLLGMELIKRRVTSGFRVCFFNNCIDIN